MTSIFLSLLQQTRAQVYGEVPVYVSHGNQYYPGQTVTVSNTGNTRTEMTFKHCFAAPYTIGINYNSQPGSYSYSFSNPVTKVRFRISATNIGEVNSFYVNGTQYMLTTQHLSALNACDTQFFLPLSIENGNAIFKGPVIPNQAWHGNFGSGVITIEEPGGIDSIRIHNNGVMGGSSFGFSFWGDHFPPDSITIRTAGGVPAIIETEQGTLQLESQVYPLTADQHVSWSIDWNPGGHATIDHQGFVQALSAGTVRARVTSIANIYMSAFIDILIKETPVKIDSIRVSTVNNIAPIITDTNQLSLMAVIYPDTLPQNVHWQILPIDGDASIDTAGNVTGIANGSVWAKATAINDSTMSDSITISIQKEIPTTGAIENTEMSSISRMSIFPNPVHDKLIVETGNPIRPQYIQVLDLYGKVVLTTTPDQHATAGIFQIPVSHLAPGLYWLRISNHSSLIYGKFIKQ